MGSPDVAVIGGGLIGLGIAWKAAQRGLVVTVLDPNPGRGASWAAAGMLAPVTEVHYGEEALLRLNLAGAARCAAFAAELEETTGCPIDHRRCGTLSLAFDGDDDAALEDLHRHLLGLGLPAQRLTARECRQLEPMLSPAVRSGLLAPEDHQIDNRRLVEGLLEAARRLGVRLDGRRAAGVEITAGRATGVRLESGEQVVAGTVVVAAGAWSGALLEPPLAPPVRPVKGQILVLRGERDSPLLSRNVRGLVRGSSVYLVPRRDGRLIVGATVEERGFDVRRTVEATRMLLRDAQLLAPGVDELELLEVSAGLRPGTPDNSPVLGAGAAEGLVMATGHYRNGVLLTPLTAESIAALLAGETPSERLAPFSPARFAAAGSPAAAPA